MTFADLRAPGFQSRSPNGRQGDALALELRVAGWIVLLTRIYFTRVSLRRGAGTIRICGTGPRRRRRRTHRALCCWQASQCVSLGPLTHLQPESTFRVVVRCKPRWSRPTTFACVQRRIPKSQLGAGHQPEETHRRRHREHVVIRARALFVRADSGTPGILSDLRGLGSLGGGERTRRWRLSFRRVGLG